MRKLVTLKTTAFALLFPLVAWAFGTTGARLSRAGGHEFLLGHATVERKADTEAADRSEAFPFTSARNGKAESLYLYVDGANHASATRAAIYSNVRGYPGRLLTTGTTTHRVLHGWNRIALRGAPLHRRTRYWIAVLGSGGVLAYRDRRTAACHSDESAQTGLARFPAHWRAGPTWPTCFLSAYVTGPGKGAKRPAPSTNPKAPTPPGPTGAPSPPGTPPGPPGPGTPTGNPPTQTNCVSHPSACGYPDTSNTGVPPNTALTNSGSITVTTPGAVISGLNVTGTIYVNADNVTIKDTRVSNSSPSGWAIHVDSKVSGTIIEDSTVSGQDAGPNAVEYAVDSGGNNTQAIRVQMYNCTECYAGAGLLKDSYAITNANVSGAHYEDVYYGGGSEALNVEHDTLLNPHEQTASVFAGSDFGPEQNLVIDNNLLAGGGYVIYAGAGDPGTRNVQITNNRFSTIYFAQGGLYGLDAYVVSSVTTWTGNFWDNTLRPAGE